MPNEISMVLYFIVQVWFGVISTILPTLAEGFGAKTGDHAIYISVVEINRPLNTEASVKIKVFANDISDALFNYQRKRYKFSDDQECVEDSEAISGYFKDHLKITINNSLVSMVFERCEVNGESVWFSFKAVTPDNWQEFKVENDHLMELFPTQINIFNVSNGVQKKMFKLTSSQKSLTFNFPN